MNHSTTDYKKLYWSLQHKIKNDVFYSDNRKMRTINKQLVEQIEELKDKIDELETKYELLEKSTTTTNVISSTQRFTRGSNIVKRDIQPVRQSVIQPIIQPKPVIQPKPIITDNIVHTRCIAIKKNGSRCRQCGKDTQSGGPIINNYCKYHR